MAPGTEFAREFCAGIGPLQLGVVLVLSIFSVKKNQNVIMLILELSFEYMGTCSVDNVII